MKYLKGYIKMAKDIQVLNIIIKIKKYMKVNIKEIKDGKVIFILQMKI